LAAPPYRAVFGTTALGGVWKHCQPTARVSSDPIINNPIIGGILQIKETMIANKPMSVDATTNNDFKSDDDAMEITTTNNNTVGPNRKVVDNAFELLFVYKWGTTFEFDAHKV
jgi:hypothetical protein